MKENSLLLKAKFAVYQWLLKTLTPQSDQHVTSSFSIHMLSCKQVMRILKPIR